MRLHIGEALDHNWLEKLPTFKPLTVAVIQVSATLTAGKQQTTEMPRLCMFSVSRGMMFRCNPGTTMRVCVHVYRMYSIPAFSIQHQREVGSWWHFNLHLPVCLTGPKQTRQGDLWDLWVYIVNTVTQLCVKAYALKRQWCVLALRMPWWYGSFALCFLKFVQCQL